MKAVVTGGTGLVGSQVVALLSDHGQEAEAASPARASNALTGEGLAEAFAGADVVVDLTNSPSFADDDVMRFFTTSTANPLADATPPITGASRRPCGREISACAAPSQSGRRGCACRRDGNLAGGSPAPRRSVRAAS